jgi:hypothetical protein
VTVSPTEVPVQAQLEAYNAQDVERFVACYTEDVEAFELPAATLLFASRAAMRTKYAALFAAHPNQHCRLLSRAVEGAFVVDHEEITGRADGKTAHVLAIYQVADGLIRRVWFAR